MKIVFLDDASITLGGDMDFSCLESLGQYESYPNSNEDEAIERAAGAEYVVANKVPMTAKVITALPDLKMISVIATGYNNVDLEAAKQHGVTVCNVVGYAINTVPQHAFALILNLMTKIHLYNADVKAGKWRDSSSFNLLTYSTLELAGRTIGIIGFGNIGRGVARIAESFGMKVLVYDICDIEDQKYSATELNVLLQDSDIVTVHCPLTDQTRDLIDTDAIGRMKHGSFIINTARGGIVNEEALADALGSGKIAGAGFDVLTKEPPSGGNALLDAPNTIVTPHSAWSTVEARQKLVDETAENIKAHQAGKPRHVVA